MIKIEKRADIKSSYEKVADELRNTLDHNLRSIFTDFIEKSDSALFELANEAGSNDEQKQFFELLQSLRANKHSIVRVLLNEISSGLKAKVSPDIKVVNIDVLSKHDDYGELSLVSQDTMEETLLINSIDRKSSEAFKEDIAKLGRRIDCLEELKVNVFNNSAISPLSFCKAFKEVLTHFDYTSADKLVLYKLYDNSVTEKLNVIYDVLNNLFVEAGILPDINLYNMQETKPAVRKPQKSFDREQQAHHDEINAGRQSDSAASNKQQPQYSYANSGLTSDRQVAVAQGHGARDSGNSSEPGYFTTQGNSLGAANNSHNYRPSENDNSGTKTNSAASQKPATARVVGGYPVERASEIISKYIGSTDINEGFKEGSVRFYGHNDVLSALSKMQAQTHELIQRESPVVSKINSSAIKQELVSEISSQQGGTVTKQISAALDKTIDFIKLIFDAIIEDSNISDSIKALLLTLQIPVIKASMIDQDFFIDDKHPARRLLDRIAEIGVGISSHSDEFYKLIHKVVQKLLAEYSRDQNAFTKALDEIEKIIKDRQKSVSEKERGAQKDVQKLHARKVVLVELRKATYGKKLPSQLHMLLLKLWPTMMFNHYIKNGKENNEWNDQVLLLNELTDSIQPPTENVAFENIKSGYIDLINRVEKQLDKFSQVIHHKAAAIEALRQTVTDAIDSYIPVKNELLRVANDEDGEYNNNNDIENDNKRIDQDEQVSQRDKLKLLPSNVRPGVWFQLTMENKRIRRLKLSIIIVDEALLVFVDHNGQQIAERDAETLADELKSGAANMIIHHSVFDSALGSVFETIK
ncbi:MAG: DUF1631 domain-containing protein [Gammaproteobacteria bacterium]|nr:DUF1631 domain-containing protein [Gammaproteobacteria bacterium]